MQEKSLYPDDSDEAEWPTGEEESLDVREQEGIRSLKEAKEHRHMRKESAPAEAKEHKKAKKEKVHTDEKAEHKKTDGDGEKDFWKDVSTWRFAAVVFLVLLVVSLFTNGFSFSSGGVSGALGSDEAAAKAVAFIEDNLLQPGMSATVESSQDTSGLYNIKLSIQGQKFDSYVTKDGKLFFPQGIDLSAALPTNNPGVPRVPAVVEVSADDDPFIGSVDAPVTIIEFSDFQCPFCARFFSDTEKQLIEKYVNTGKVKLVYRDFPLSSIHQQATPASEAAECADEQVKFWEFHDELFENQQQLSVENYKKWAAELGLDSDKFNDCVDTRKYKSEVEKDTADGSAAGVSGTPSFFVNGVFLEGAQPIAAFDAVIEQALAAGDDSDNFAAVSEQEDEAVPVDVDITAKRFRFDPTEVSVAAGSLVRLHVKSTDVDFNFVVPEFGVELDLTPGETANAEFVADKTGSFAFTCSECDGKEAVMKGSILVR